MEDVVVAAALFHFSVHIPYSTKLGKIGCQPSDKTKIQNYKNVFKSRAKLHFTALQLACPSAEI